MLTLWNTHPHTHLTHYQISQKPNKHIKKTANQILKDKTEPLEDVNTALVKTGR